MIQITSSSLRTTFMTKAVIDKELLARLRDELKQKESLIAQQERIKRKDAEERTEAEEQEFAEVMVLATAAQISAFNERMDLYDSAGVEALMINERELREVKLQLDKSLLQATQLPDGRRVFKSEDGAKVFDEFGKEVSSELIVPEQIEDAKERFEPYWAKVTKAQELTEERQELHDFQTKLDETREKANKEGVTEDELEKLKADIDAAAPQRVRDLVAGKIDIAPAKSAPGQDGAGLDDLEIPSITKRSDPALGLP